MKTPHRLALGILAAAALVAGTASANVLSNPDFSAGGPATSFAGTGGGGLSAAPSWTVFNNAAGLTKTEHLPSFAGRSGVIHVTTAGGSNGLVQVWAPINTGPSKVVTSASIFVRSGKVLIGTGNGGNTGANAVTSGTGQWQQIRGTNQVCPANETIIYSSGGPADFYVDSAAVEVLSKDPCPQTPGGPTGQGKPDLVVTQFGMKAWGKCEAHSAVYTFQVTVKNQGNAASPSSAALGNKALVQAMAQDKPGWGNGVLLNALAPGASQTVDIPVYYLMSDPAFMVNSAPHPFKAIADPLGLVNESNEGNNEKGPINMGAPQGCAPARPAVAAPKK